MQVTPRRMTLYRTPESRHALRGRALGPSLYAVPSAGLHGALAARAHLEVVLANSPLPGVQAYVEQKVRWSLWHPTPDAAPPGSRLDLRM